MKKHVRKPARAATRDSRASLPTSTSDYDSGNRSRGLPALWALLALLAVSRAVSSFVPSMAMWSLNLPRFLAPVPAWLPWAIATLALVPAIARPMASLLERVGAWMASYPTASACAWAAGAALLVLATPDRSHFVGDFILRESTLREQLAGQAWYPQALPLDLFIHESFARWLMTSFGLTPNATGRAIGAVEAAMFGALAIHLSRVLALRGAAAFAVPTMLFWGGYLTLFTGYNKAFTEMTLLTAAVGVFALEVARSGRGLSRLALVLFLALLLHRSALGLLPAAITAGVIWVRSQPPGSMRRWPFLTALGLTLGVLAVMLPRILSIVTRVDSMHFAPVSERGSGFLVSTFGHGRVVDMFNLIVMLSPLALLAPWLAVAAGRLEHRETWIVATLALPFLLVLPFIHPGQGYLRDWDDFASAGVALSLLTAWLAAAVLRSARSTRWLAAALALGAVAPSMQWLLHEGDLDRSLARAEAFMTQSPKRPSMERYTTWKYVGVRAAAAHQLDRSARAYAEAANEIASPDILHQWAMIETQRQNFSSARDVYVRLVERNPKDIFAWWMLAVSCSQLEDWPAAERATRRVLALDPTHAGARQALADMVRARPDSARRD